MVSLSRRVPPSATMFESIRTLSSHPGIVLLLSTVLATFSITPCANGQISQFPYSEDFESGAAGFLAGGPGIPFELGSPSGFAIFEAGSQEQAWVTGLNGLFQQSSEAFLESPQFDFTQLGDDPTLAFLLNFQLGASAELVCELSVDGGPYTLLGQAGDPESLNWYNGPSQSSWVGSSGDEDEWQETRHILEGAAGHMASIRWRLDAPGGVPIEGAGVDFVRIYDQFIDLELERVFVPSGHAPLESPITLEVLNSSTVEVDQLSVDVIASGPTNQSFTETIAVSIPVLETVQFQLTQLADLPLPGIYTLEISISPGMPDEVPGNNLIAFDVTSQPTITQFPYLEDFENGPGGFASQGVLSTWEHGIPAADFISGAESGLRAWVTNLDGLASPFETSALQSPLLDLRDMENDPFLQFEHIFEIETGFTPTQHFAAISIDGNPFMTLGEPGDPASLNWYENFPVPSSSGFGWIGTSGPPDGWRTARHLLEGAAGHLVSVRIILIRAKQTAFSSPPIHGAGIDDFSIFEAPLGNGQPAEPGLALLDISDSMDVIGLPPSFGQPGPHFTSISTSGLLQLRIEGPPSTPIALFSGTLAPNSIDLGPIGQADLSSPQVVASGLAGGVLGSFFFTNPEGNFSLDLSVPLSATGMISSFQAVLLGLPEIQITNAVQVNFVP